MIDSPHVGLRVYTAFNEVGTIMRSTYTAATGDSRPTLGRLSVLDHHDYRVDLLPGEDLAEVEPRFLKQLVRVRGMAEVDLRTYRATKVVLESIEFADPHASQQLLTELIGLGEQHEVGYVAATDTIVLIEEERDARQPDGLSEDP